MADTDMELVQEIINGLGLFLPALLRKAVQDALQETLNAAINADVNTGTIIHLLNTAIPADELINKIAQKVLAGSTALALPDHSPTGQDNQQLLQILHRLGRMEGFMVGMQKQI